MGMKREQRKKGSRKQREDKSHFGRKKKKIQQPMPKLLAKVGIREKRKSKWKRKTEEKRSKGTKETESHRRRSSTRWKIATW